MELLPFFGNGNSPAFNFPLPTGLTGTIFTPVSPRLLLISRFSSPNNQVSIKPGHFLGAFRMVEGDAATATAVHNPLGFERSGKFTAQQSVGVCDLVGGILHQLLW